MDEFEQRKRDVLQPIFFEAGAALFDCQSFEYDIAYLLYLFSRLGTKGLDPSLTVAIMENEEKKTAGRLIGILKKHLQVSENIEERLSEALAARNELVHRYFTTNIERMANLDEHGQIVKEIRSLRSTVQKSNKQLEPFIKGLAEALDGVSIGEVFHEGKEKFMSDSAPK